MSKSIVKRCVRPQCMEIYPETIRNRFCSCGALLQMIEIEVKTQKNTYKKPVNQEGKKEDYDYRKQTAFLYLLLEDKEVKFELSNNTRIGRSADGVQVDIDLAEYAGKDVSREHAVIKKEKDGYYITNVSKNHSVRIMDQDENEVALEFGKKVLLKSEDGILLSKKILLQFVEEI